jgi:hypothetical protein
MIEADMQSGHDNRPSLRTPAPQRGGNITTGLIGIAEEWLSTERRPVRLSTGTDKHVERVSNLLARLALPSSHRESRHSARRNPRMISGLSRTPTG